MTRLVKFTMPEGQDVYINADAVLNVHEVFRSDQWAVGASTVIIYGDGLKIGVREDLQTVLDRLEGMNIVGETGKVATGFIDALKGSPLLLVLAVTNFATIGFVYLQSSQFTAQRQDNVKLFVEQQLEFNRLLSRCIVPGSPTTLRPPFKPVIPFKDVTGP